MGVLLVDCQGTGDLKKSNTNLDILIAYISMQISSVNITNLNAVVGVDDLAVIQVCSETKHN